MNRMRRKGFTRASTLGPIIDQLRLSGAAPSAVFAKAAVPLGLPDRPDLYLPLREHFTLLHASTRATGDELFAARLGQRIEAHHVGVYGEWVMQAATLLGAIDRANRSLPHLMQSATTASLHFEGSLAIWSYESHDSAQLGRQQNEMLALGHMMVMVRAYTGPRWHPLRFRLSGRMVRAKSELCQLMQADLEMHACSAALMFDQQLLTCRRHPGIAGCALHWPDPIAARAPDDECLVDMVRTLVELQLLDGPPALAQIAQRLSLSERTLQRRLADGGARFSQIADTVKERVAQQWVANSNHSITDIAARLGYSDATHFSRAFGRWTGASPRAWRKSLRQSMG